MQTKEDGERLAILETNMANIEKRLGGIENSMSALHGKFDLLSQNYVAKETFEEFKKNKWLERILIIIMTSIITGLIAHFLNK